MLVAHHYETARQFLGARDARQFPVQLAIETG